MPTTRVRDIHGRYETTKQLVSNIDIPVPSKRFIYKIIGFIFLGLLISPWVYIIFIKNDAFGNTYHNISEYFDNNFSCKAFCHKECLNITDYPKNENGKGGL